MPAELTADRQRFGRLSIRTRLTVAYALFAALTLVGLGAFLVLRLRADLRTTIEHDLRGNTAAIAADLRQDGLAGFAATGGAAVRRTGSAAQVLDPRGNVVASRGGDLAQDPMLSAAQTAIALRSAPRIWAVRLGDSGLPYLVLSQAATPGRLVLVGESLRSEQEAVRSVLVLLGLAGPIGLALTAVAAWVLVGRALAPVDRLRQGAETIELARLDTRLPEPPVHDEIGQLATTLNAMLSRLADGVSAQRRLVADASHELRTPLAAMRAELDVALRDPDRPSEERETLVSLREDVDRMSRTVTNLLALARADAGRLELKPAQLDLGAVAGRAAEGLRSLAVSARVTLTVDNAPAVARGDAEGLELAIRNLVENAVTHTPAGGRVAVRSWRAPGAAGVRVADTGAGIPEPLRRRVFERFFRVDGSRSRESGGSGLGLAICAEIVQAHGGRVWVTDGPEGGSEFWLEIPAGRA